MPLLTTQSAKGYGWSTATVSVNADFVALATYNVTGSSTASITFSSIAGTYSSLWVIGNHIASSGGPNFNWTYNGGGGTYNYLYNENATGGNANGSSSALGSSGSSNGTSMILKIPDYATTNKYKTATVQGGNEVYSSTMCNTWQNTSAITSITFVMATGNIAVGSNLTLYGLK